MDFCDNTLQQCAAVSPRRLHRQPTESDVTDNFLLQVKREIIETNYDKIDEKENIPSNLRRLTVPAAQIFWISRTVSPVRICRLVVTSRGAKRIARIVLRLMTCWIWTDRARQKKRRTYLSSYLFFLSLIYCGFPKILFDAYKKSRKVIICHRNNLIMR